jgi:stage V sporulation protein SpoVS
VAATSEPAEEQAGGDLVCVVGDDLAADLDAVGRGVMQQRGAVAVCRAPGDEVRLLGEDDE